MEICIHGRPKTECQLKNLEGVSCNPLVIGNPPQSGLLVAANAPFVPTTGIAPALRNGVDSPPPAKPDITDPRALNAMELAKALDEAANLKGVVVSLTGMLKNSQEELRKAEIVVRTKLDELTNAVGARNGHTTEES